MEGNPVEYLVQHCVLNVLLDLRVGKDRPAFLLPFLGSASNNSGYGCPEARQYVCRAIHRSHNDFFSAFMIKNGKLICMLGCTQTTRWMYPAEAARHEESREHILLVRQISQAGDPLSSPFHMSSPPQYSSDPASPTIDESPDIIVEPLLTVPGPQLAGDRPDVIYDDWDAVWESRMPTRPDADSPEAEEYYFGHPDHSNEWYDPPDALDTDIDGSEEEEVPNDDPFETVSERTEIDFEGVGEEFVLNIDELPEEQDHGPGHFQSTSAEDWWPWASREVKYVYDSLNRQSTNQNH